MALIAQLKALSTPTPATQAKQLNVNNYMLDSASMIQTAILDAQELRTKLLNLQMATDAADPNYNAITTALGNL